MAEQLDRSQSELKKAHTLPFFLQCISRITKALESSAETQSEVFRKHKHKVW